MHLQLAVELLDVRRDGVRRDVEEVSDFGEAQALGEEDENVVFTLREGLVLLSFGLERFFGEGPVSRLTGPQGAKNAADD